MTRRWSEAPIRVRVTAWYAGALALLLIVYAAVTYAAVRHEFLEEFDDQLHDDFETAESLLQPQPNGGVAWAGDQQRDLDDDASRVYEVWSPTGAQLSRSGASVPL